MQDRKMTDRHFPGPAFSISSCLIRHFAVLHCQTT